MLYPSTMTQERDICFGRNLANAFSINRNAHQLYRAQVRDELYHSDVVDDVGENILIVVTHPEQKQRDHDE